MENNNEILIVGSSGFLANELCKNLILKAQKVAFASSNPRNKINRNKNLIDLNQSTFKVLNEISILKPTEIVYCSSKYVNDSIKEVFFINFFLPLLISTYARIHKIRFIYIGTYWQLFPKMSRKYINRYTLSKSVLTLLLRILNYKSHNKINLLIICDNFGYNDKRGKLIPYLLECYKNKTLPIIKTPHDYISLVPINTVVQTILNIISYSDKFCYYCINEFSINVSDLQRMIHEIYLDENINEHFELRNEEFFIDTQRALKIDQKYTTKILVIPELVKTVYQFKIGEQS
jgi:nucleoside-diphosphate-sugar epimerase